MWLWDRFWKSYERNKKIIQRWKENITTIIHATINKTYDCNEYSTYFLTIRSHSMLIVFMFNDIGGTTMWNFFGLNPWTIKILTVDGKHWSKQNYAIVVFFFSCN